MLLPLCRLALDDIHSNHDPLLTLTRSRMTVGGAGGGGPQVPGQQLGESLIIRLLSLFHSPMLGIFHGFCLQLSHS